MQAGLTLPSISPNNGLLRNSMYSIFLVVIMKYIRKYVREAILVRSYRFKLWAVLMSTLLLAAKCGADSSAPSPFLLLLGNDDSVGAGQEPVEGGPLPPPEPQELEFNVKGLKYREVFRGGYLEVYVETTGDLPLNVRPVFLTSDGFGVYPEPDSSHDFELQPGQTSFEVYIPEELSSFSGGERDYRYVGLCRVRPEDEMWRCYGRSGKHIEPSNPDFSDETFYIGSADTCPAPCNARIEWRHNQSSFVHRSGGGYEVCYSEGPSFGEEHTDPVICSNTPYVSGEKAPEETVISLENPGTYFFRVSAYAEVFGEHVSGGYSRTDAIVVTEP